MLNDNYPAGVSDADFEDNSDAAEKAERFNLDEISTELDGDDLYSCLEYCRAELLKKGIELDGLMREWAELTKDGRNWLEKATEVTMDRWERASSEGPEQ